MINRRKTKKIFCGGMPIGGDSPISIQSMTNTKTWDVAETLSQIHRLKKAGCEIVRLAIPDMRSAEAIVEIKKHIDMPVIADIHFDHKLALAAVESGADKIRINPGNIVRKENLERIALSCMERSVPIRIGVNSGSLSGKIRKKHKHATAEAITESALEYIYLFESFGFGDIVVSVKSSDVLTTVESYRRLSKETDYPLHIGVTEAGTFFNGSVKSSIGIGSLLIDGIGDTLRVSITGDPVKEIRIAREILGTLGIRNCGYKIISCPTCGRTTIDLEKLVNSVEERIFEENMQDKPITIAVMGCEVNGPGEAKEADIGIAASKGKVFLFRKGEIVGNSNPENILDLLISEIKKI